MIQRIESKNSLKNVGFGVVSLLMSTQLIYSQNIGINATGATPNSSTILDLNTGNTFTSPNGKGLLCPNVALTSTADATTIASPATSLFVYNTNTISDVTPGFYYWSGSAWVRFLTGVATTDWAITGNSGTTNGTHFVGTSDNQALDIRTNNVIRTRITTKGQIEVLNTNSSVFVGEGAGNSNSGAANNFVGYQAGYTNTTGAGNNFSGYQAGYTNSTGAGNTAVGYQSLKLNTTASYNTSIGGNSLRTNTTGDKNTALGIYTLENNSTGASNTAIGYQALNSNSTASSNLAIGENSLKNNTTGTINLAMGNYSMYTNTTGGYNIAIGDNALYNNTASTNIGIGYFSMYTNTTGTNNTAVGYNAMRSNSTGFQNIAFGQEALYSNTTGSYNSGYGYLSLYSNSTGTNNSAFGIYSLYNETTGNENTAYGKYSLIAVSTASYNTAIGAASGGGLTTGSYNTFLGYGTSSNTVTRTNSIAIGGNGNLAFSGDNNVRIGNSSMSSIGGQVGWTTISDKRVKENVTANVPGLNFINKLTPVTYTYNLEKENKLMGINDTTSQGIESRIQNSKTVYSGFLAQDVDSLAKSINYNFSGVDKPQDADGVWGIRYAEFTVPLVKAVQELSELAKQQQLIMEQQQILIEQLQQQNSEIIKTLQRNK